MIENIGPYRILQLLGQGGMGQVYLGEHPETHDRVAIKILLPTALEDDPFALERAQREAEALRRLNHPSIVKVLDVAEIDEQFVIIMEYVGGGSLYSLISQKQPLPLGYVLRVGLELSDALTRAHHLKIIHRDLKPANILLAEDGTSRLTDFGVARLESEDNITQTGAIVGSPSYLAPEMITGEPFDHRADIWAFGVVLFELLKGGRLFEGNNPAETMYKVIHAPLPKLSDIRDDVPPALNKVIYQMLERNPKLRINSMRKVGAILEEVIKELGTGVRDELPPLVRSLIQQSQERTESRIIQSQKTALLRSYRRKNLPTQSTQTNWLLGSILVLLVVLVGLMAWLIWGEGEAKNSTAFEVTTVEPLSANKMMILVAEFESLDDSNQRATDFILRDLQNRLENGSPLANVEIRAYPFAIETQAQALQAAQANNAVVVIWGNSRQGLIEATLQMTAEDATFEIPLDELRATTDVLVHMKDAQLESLADEVATILFLYHTARDDSYATVSALTVSKELEPTSPEIIGNDVGAYVHQYMRALFADPDEAVQLAEAALKIDPRNPMLYHLNASALQRAGQLAEARENAQTALRLGRNSWQMPHVVLGNIALQENEYEVARDEFQTFTAVYPEDWFIRSILGVTYYLEKDYDNATQTYAELIAFDPPSSIPYIFASLLAIREGRIADFQALLEIIFRDFPDSSIGVRVIEASTGGRDGGGAFYGYLLSGYVNLTLGQNHAALEDVNAALELRDDVPEVYLMQGLAYCLMGDQEAALGAYSNGLILDPDFTVLYLLRADSATQQNQMGEALLNLEAAKGTNHWVNAEPFVTEVLAQGTLGCDSFLSR